MPVSNIIPHRPIDCFHFKVKAKDMPEFTLNTWAKLSDCMSKNNKSVIFVSENPNYPAFVESTVIDGCDKWIVGKLNEKGYNVTSPLNEDPELITNLYFFKSSNVIKSYQQKFESGLLKKINFYKDLARTFINSVPLSLSLAKSKKGTIKLDSYDNKILNFYMENKMTQYSDNRFQKFLKNLNVREIDFKPENK